MRETRRAALAWALAALLCLCFLSIAAAEPQTVRISYGYNNFLQVEDGEMTGYYAQYLKKLAEINNWRYSLVESTWAEAMDMLAAGEIDLLFPVNYSSEREASMDFSTMAIGYTASGIYALEDSGYHYDDFAAYDGARIAFSRSSSNAVELAEYAMAHGFSYQPVYRESNWEMIEALQQGEADLVVFSAAHMFPGGNLVSIMDAKPVYFAVRKGNEQMLDQVNQGMQTIVKINPDLASDVQRKSLLGENGSPIGMTREERALIDSGREIVVGFYESSEPLSYVRENGVYDGVFINLLEKVRDMNGLNFVLRPITRDKLWLDLVKSGEIDFYVGASNVVIATEPDIQATNPFMQYSNVLATRPEVVISMLDKPVIALPYSRKNWSTYLGEYFDREVEIQFYDSYKECMNAVVDKQADATLINNLQFNYHSKNRKLSSLILWPQLHFTTEICMAASKQLDPVIFSAVDKALGQLDSVYVNVIVDECLGMQYHSYNFADYLYMFRNALAISVLLLLSGGAIACVYVVLHRRHIRLQNEAKAREQHQLQILAAMSYDYSAMYYVDLDENTSETISTQKGLKEKLDINKQKTIHRYDEALRQYTETYVLPEYRDRIMVYADRSAVLDRFVIEPQFAILYQIMRDVRRQDYFEIHFVRVENNQQGHRMMVLGIRCVDEAVQEEQRQRRLLQDALDGANRANAAKSEFFSRMSHDIRTPLNAIIGMTAIASAHAQEPARVLDAMNKITGASRHLLSLINDVLDMSKIETGKLHLTEEDINLNELLESMLDIVRPQIEQHKHKLQVSVQGVRHEAVIGDSLRIRQIFTNLMSNAIKYTPDGGNISLTLRERPINTASAGCYEFVFADNGIGMSKEYQKHLFEPFVREEDVRTSKIQGTGLGMPITQNIVQMMNGNIQVDSEIGRGTTITVTIFLKLQEKASEDVSELAGLPVLVVEDDADTCESVCVMLEEIGMKGYGFTSGFDAVEAVRRMREKGESLYAAIVDWKMPGMNGLETARALKELTEKQLPVIILSAYDWSEIEEEARSVGVDDFLCKPMFRSNLIRLFKSMKNGETHRHTENEGFAVLSDAGYAGRKILLVEDNLLNMEIARELLEMISLSVDEAENGRAALEKFLASPSGYYDLILMDIQMPVMNGLEATKAIRASTHPDARSVPIIAMTANAFVEDAQTAKEAGMNEHLAKPIDFANLDQVLRKYLVKKS